MWFCCLNDDSEHGVHESWRDHLTELIDPLHCLTQEIDHYAVPVPGQHHLDVWDGTACQHWRKSGHHSRWNAALIQGGLVVVSQLVLNGRAIVCCDVFSQSSNQLYHDRWRLFQSVDDTVSHREMVGRKLLCLLRHRWIHVHVDWHGRCNIIDTISHVIKLALFTDTHKLMSRLKVREEFNSLQSVMWKYKISKCINANDNVHQLLTVHGANSQRSNRRSWNISG